MKNALQTGRNAEARAWTRILRDSNFLKTRTTRNMRMRRSNDTPDTSKNEAATHVHTRNCMRCRHIGTRKLYSSTSFARARSLSHSLPPSRTPFLWLPPSHTHSHSQTLSLSHTHTTPQTWQIFQKDR
jgi:hypothetical protein